MRIDVAGIALTRFQWTPSGRTANANRTWSVREAVMLEIRARDGTTGYGEAAPLPGFSHDNLDGCCAELTAAFGRLDAISLDDDADAVLSRSLASSGVTSPAAAFALESAVLDLLGKARGVPTWSLLRGVSPPPPAIPLAALLRESEPGRVADEAASAVSRGIRVAKLKIGGPASLKSDVARLEAARATGIAVRLDANQSLGSHGLPPWLAALAPLEPELLEEPVPTEEWRSLPAGPLDYAMDESLMEDGWAQRIEACAAVGSCSALVLKPMALGLIRCLALARSARERGWQVYVTHLFDGPIAAAAAAELALSIPGPVAACGLDAFGRDGDWPSDEVHQIGSASIDPSTLPGLGVDEIARAIAKRAQSRCP